MIPFFPRIGARICVYLCICDVIVPILPLYPVTYEFHLASCLSSSTEALEIWDSLSILVYIIQCHSKNFGFWEPIGQKIGLGPGGVVGYKACSLLPSTELLKLWYSLSIPVYTIQCHSKNFSFWEPIVQKIGSCPGALMQCWTKY